MADAEMALGMVELLELGRGHTGLPPQASMKEVL